MCIRDSFQFAHQRGFGEARGRLRELPVSYTHLRVDMVENRFVGIKSRGVYETPGGTIIYVAHKDLEGITMERETMHIRDMMMPSYAGAIYNGFWYSPEREAMQAFIDKSQERVSGTVRLKLYKGNAWPVGRESKNTLYCADLEMCIRDRPHPSLSQDFHLCSRPQHRFSVIAKMSVLALSLIHI